MSVTKTNKYKYEIREFKSSSKPLYTWILNEKKYKKQFIIYEQCSKFDYKYYPYPVYAGSHTYSLVIENDNYGFLLEKWFNTELFKNLYKINKSSQYIKASLVKHIKLPPVNLNVVDNIESIQKEFYNLT